MSKIAIIGGGAAGMLAAGFAATKDNTVYLIEPNKLLGKKLRITGKGRCNITNAADISDFFSEIPTNPKFLYSAFDSFTNLDIMRLLESLNVKCKTERGGRIFPISDNAHDVADALKKFALKSNVTLLHDSAKSLICRDNKICGVVTSTGKLECDKVILATGGMSYPLTGSTGDGYKMAESLGHTIIPPKSSLIPIVIKESLCNELMGLSLKNVTLSVFGKGKKPIFSELGEMLFTHFGISGPLALSASSHMKNIEKNNYVIKIDLKPGLDTEMLDKRIRRDFDENLNKQLQNGLSKLLPKALIPIVIKMSEIPPETTINAITKQQRMSLVNTLKNFTLTPTGFRPVSEAIITSGGIKVSEINPATMESKIISGLYFAGEIIDCDAYTGGYNLQIAWSTGQLAGISAAKN